MEEIIKMMNEYAEKHKIKGGVYLWLGDNYSGAIIEFLNDDKTCFYFNSIDELKQKLKE